MSGRDIAGFFSDIGAPSRIPNARMADPAPRLFLVTPVVADAKAFAPSLAQAIGAGDVACVLVRHGARDERGAKAVVRDLAATVQARGAALLVEDDPRLAAHADADGVHVRAGGDALADAVERMKPARIVGCGGFASRHDAMEAAEVDVDYLLFGEPGPDGALPDPGATLDQVRWWAEIFNVPCVAFAGRLGDVRALAEAGAEFIGLGDAVWADARGPAAAVADALAEVAAATRAVEGASA